MKDPGPRIPSLCNSFIPAGGSVIHFYYSPQEQLRFSAFLTDGLRLGHGVVLGATPELCPRFVDQMKLWRVRGGLGQLQQVALTSDLPSSIARLTEAVRDQALQHGQARLLADFSGLASHEQVFEVEAGLSSSFSGLRVVTISQYDGNAVSALVTVEQFKTHSIAIVGNAFYYENRRHIPPEAYFRKRGAAAAAAP